MIELIEANWLAFALALLIGLVVAWWVFGRATSAPKRSQRPDALDEGVAPAARNQALIDAPPVAVPFAGAGMAGIGEIVAAAAAQEINDADAAAATCEVPDLPANPPAQTLSTGDDLSRIKGVGPKLVVLLGTLGVTQYAQIAAWSEADIDRIDGHLGAFAGRIRRDDWVGQCRYLAAGDTAGFEGTFGKL